MGKRKLPDKVTVKSSGEETEEEVAAILKAFDEHGYEPGQMYEVKMLHLESCPAVTDEGQCNCDPEVASITLMPKN